MLRGMSHYWGIIFVARSKKDCWIWLISELDDGAINPLWTMRGFTQTFHMWKENKRAQSVPLNAFLTYVTLPWWAITKGTFIMRNTINESWGNRRKEGCPWAWRAGPHAMLDRKFAQHQGRLQYNTLVRI